MAKRVLVVNDVRTFQPCEGLELVHVRTVKDAQRALGDVGQEPTGKSEHFDELWLDYHLEWNHLKPHEENFHSGARLARWLRVEELQHMVVRVVSDLDDYYIRKITDSLDDAGYTYTLNPDGEGLPTPYVRTYS